MRVLYNEDLRKYTSVRIGGTAKAMFVPENTGELLELAQKQHPVYFVGGGSNLLINDRVFDKVVDLRYFDPTIEDLGDGQFKVGASVRLQKMIDFINEKGYGGIEYLYSVPGLVGGAIVMNAGRGKQYHKSISDYVVSVTAIDNGKLVDLKKDECGFDHRTSVFKNAPYIVVSALFCFPRMSLEDTSKAKKERIALCKERQDTSRPNFGSVFIESNSRIMSVARKLRIGCKKVHFSGKTINWIINEGNGSYAEVKDAIHKVEHMHKLFGKKCELEVIIWE